MELYRNETYKQLQVLNLLDIVIVSKMKKTSNFVYSTNESYVRII